MIKDSIQEEIISNIWKLVQELAAITKV
jgi:hypothetical protein